MDPKQSQQIKKYIDLIIRRKTMIIIFILISIVVGLGLYLRTNKVYRTTALLSYQQQKVRSGKMSPDLQARIRDTVSTLGQIVTSRTNLENVIKEFDLYTEERHRLPMEDVIEYMREHISIKPSSRGDTFHVSYEGQDARKVVKVTNALAAKFIEENLKYREERASETSSYTRDELQMAKGVLDKKEGSMRDYKLKFYNEMPGQRQGNMSRLTTLQEQYQAKQDSIQDLERTKVMIQEQMTARKTMTATAAAAIHPVVGQVNKSPAPVSPYHQLAQLRVNLDSLLLRYTDKHPEVKRVRQMISKLESELTEKPVNEDGKPQKGASASAQQIKEPVDPVILQLELQLKQLSMDIVGLVKEKEKLKKLIPKYEKWVAAVPVREAEWSSLTREYSELKRHYDYLVAQNLQAESSLNLERKQKGSQFKIEDSARFPERPFKPDFRKIMAMAVGAGLAFGLAIAVGLDLLDTSFKDAAELEDFIGISVICSVPYIYTRKEKRNRKIIFTAQLFVLACSLASIAYLFIYFWRKGQIIL